MMPFKFHWLAKLTENYDHWTGNYCIPVWLSLDFTVHLNKLDINYLDTQMIDRMTKETLSFLSPRAVMNYWILVLTTLTLN